MEINIINARNTLRTPYTDLSRLASSARGRLVFIPALGSRRAASEISPLFAVQFRTGITGNPLFRAGCRDPLKLNLRSRA